MLSKDERHLGLKIEDKETCSKCGGYCCKKNACDCSPEDFDFNTKKMEKALETGNYSIDFARKNANAFKYSFGEWKLDIEYIVTHKDTTLYLRPRNVDRPIVDIVHQDGDEGPCIFWSKENGCSLKYRDRPKYGRLMIPIRKGFCKSVPNVRKKMILEWRPYNVFLYQMAVKYFDPDWHWYRTLRFKIE